MNQANPTVNKTREIIQKLNEGPKKTPSKKTYTYAVAAIVLVLLILGGYLFLSNRDNNDGNDNNGDNNGETININDLDEVSPTPFPTELVKEINGEVDEQPRRRAIYYVKYEGDNAFFYLPEEPPTTAINPNEETETEAETTSAPTATTSPTNDFIGQLAFGDYRTEADIDYRNLDNPLRVAEFNHEIFLLADFFLKGDNSSVHVSLIYNSSNGFESYNEIQKIDLQNNTAELSWSRLLFDETYPGFAGAAEIDALISSEYIEATLAECFECSGEVKTAKLIINTTSGDDLLLGQATNIVVDTENNQISYVVDGQRTSEELP